MQLQAPSHAPIPAEPADLGGTGKLRIAFVSCLFPPEPEPSSVMAHQLAGELRLHGHEVTVVAPFPNRPKGVLYPGYRRAFRQTDDVDGVHVVRCPTLLIGPARRAWNRMLENATFGIASSVTMALEKRPDVLLLETWPLAAVQLSIWGAKLRGVPVLYYVKDLYPETLENSGLVAKGGYLACALYRWDRRLCLASSKVIVISNKMRDALLERRHLPEEHVVVVPDWIDEREFRTFPRDNAWRSEKSIESSVFVALFAGTLGIVSGAEVLIETAARLRGRPEILLCCVGQGVLKDRMVSEAKKRGLTNLRFEAFQSRDRVPEMQAAADVCLLTMRQDCSNASVPSKLISYMAAGRPVICAAPAETDVAGAVSRARAGMLVPPGDPDALASAIIHMRENPHEAAAMGFQARRYFEEHLAFRGRYEQFLEIFTSVAQAPRKNGGIG